MGIGEFWDLIAMQPMINILIVLSHYLFGSFGLAIIALTIVVNIVLYPLTKKQLKATQAMQSIQPKLAELQKKYGKDRQKMAQEQMRMYKESGMSPAGCVVPMLIQLPVWIALFQSIMRLVAVIPENFLGLAQYLYSWPVVYTMLPLGNEFLGLNLAEGNLILAILVGGTMWLQQKMTMTPSADPKMQAQSRMMLWMMPLMFGFLCLSFPSGLALFWVTSSVIRIVIQYYITGWGGLVSSTGKKQVTRDKKYKTRIALQEEPSQESDIGADIVETDFAQEEEGGHEAPSDKRQGLEGGYPAHLQSIRRQMKRSKHQRPKRR